MTKYVEWVEPMWGIDGEILGNIFQRALPEDCVSFWKYHHPETTLSDTELLDEFMVTNWAVFKEYPDEST